MLDLLHFQIFFYNTLLGYATTFPNTWRLRYQFTIKSQMTLVLGVLIWSSILFLLGRETPTGVMRKIMGGWSRIWSSILLIWSSVRVKRRHAILLELEKFKNYVVVNEPLVRLKVSQQEDLDEIEYLTKRRHASLRRAGDKSRIMKKLM